MMHKCFWRKYQETGEFADLTRWLKHRAYMHQVISMHPKDPNRWPLRYASEHHDDER